MLVNDNDYFRDSSVYFTTDEGINERSIVFTHAKITLEEYGNVKSDFVEITINQKRDKFTGVMFGINLDDTYERAWYRANNPPTVNIVVPPNVKDNGINYDDMSEDKKPSYQVVDITGSTITLELKNMYGNAIAVYELDHKSEYTESELKNVKALKMRQKAYKKIDSYNSRYTIQNLKSLTNYNITIHDSSGEYSLLKKPVKTYFDNKNMISAKEYESIYKDKINTMWKKPDSLPASWSTNNETSAKVKDAVFFNSQLFIIHEEVIDTEPKDGINDRNNNKYADGIDIHYKNLKFFYFSNIGITVFECPYEPNYFNVDSGQAMLGKKQCYVELGEKQVYRTLDDLNKLNDKHKWDILKQTSITSSKIILSVGTDIITIVSFGTALPEVAGIKSFFKIFFDKFIKPGKVAKTNIVVSNIEGAYATATQILGGSFPKGDLSDFGEWFIKKLISTFVPGVGTYELISDLTEFKPIITETRNEKLPIYLIDGLISADEKVSGIFFNQE